MNERIKELSEQAKLIAEENINRQISYNYELKSFAEKFAELIVQECQTVVEWAISVDSTIDRVPVLIKEHFGVAE
jgi:hypothetical protein